MDRRTRRTLLYTAAALSLVAALIHLWVTPEHFEEWWGQGAFFLVAAAAQALYAGALVRWPRRPIVLLGIGGNLAIIGLYVVTRTVGIPLLGPHAGEVEAVGRVDLASKAAEVALVAVLSVLSRTAPGLRAPDDRSGRAGAMPPRGGGSRSVARAASAD